MRARSVLIALLVLAAAGAGNAAASTPLGAGAEMPAAAFQALCVESGQCAYQAGVPTAADAWAGVDGIGGVAIARHLGGTATFVPTGIGALSVVVNVPKVKGTFLKVRGDVLGEMFSGAVRNWSNARLTTTNLGVHLPTRAITLCVPARASGLSLVFSHYLSKVSSTFRQRVGTGLAPTWRAPEIVRVSNVAMVGQCIRRHKGSIGFLPFGDALQQGLGTQAISLGRPVKGLAYEQGGASTPVTTYVFASPNNATMTNAVPPSASATSLADISASTRDGAYPLSVLIGVATRSPMRADVRRVIKGFLSDSSQERLPSLGYTPLPKRLLAVARAAVSDAD